MRYRMMVMVGLAGLALTAGSALASDLVSDIVSQISQASIWDYNSRPDFLYTHPGDSRKRYGGVIGADFFLAQNNIKATFESDFGIGTATVDTAGGWNNVWVTKVGTVNPGKVYVVGSHYDSVTLDGSTDAPGGNDNASGVSAVLELARVFKDYQFKNTIIFCAFDGEESGLNGSAQWTAAWAAAHPGIAIAGMVEMDCIGYNPNDSYHDKAIVYTGHSQSLPWRTALAAAMTTYTDGAITATAANQPYDCSDYARFEDHGWQAAILAEAAVWEDVASIMHTHGGISLMRLTGP